MPARHKIPHAKKVARVVKIAPLLIEPPINYIRADGMILGRRIVRHDGQVFLQCKDRNKKRCKALGRQYVYVSIEEFMELMMNGVT